MSAVHLLCLCTLQLLFFQKTSGQAPKIPGMWSMQLATEYPNPMEADLRCKTESTPFRICDPNQVFNDSSREASNNMLKRIEGLLMADGSSDKCLCNKTCSEPRIIVVVALMKSLGPNIYDIWVEAKNLTKRFRELWKLHDCSTLLVISKDDKKYYINSGKSVLEFLTSNVTDKINEQVNGSFMNDEPEKGVTLTVQLYSKAINETTQPVPPVPSSDNTAAIVVSIVVGVIGVIILIVVIVIYWKKRNNSGKHKAPENVVKNGEAKEGEALTSKSINV